MLSSHLKYFESAAKTQNLSATARLYGVPASTVSVSIKKLEQEVGTHLFDRSANKLKLNEAGKILLVALESSRGAFRKAMADIADLSGRYTGELHLLILANRQKVTDAIYTFKKMHPDIVFTIRHTLPDNSSEIQNFDIIVADSSILAESFDKKFWFREDVLLAVHKDNPLHSRERVTHDDLKNEKFISLHKGSSLRSYTDRYFEQKNISPDMSIECDDPKYLVAYLNMGMGVAFVPIVAMGELVGKDTKLIKVDEGIHRDTFVYTNKTSSESARSFGSMLANF